MANQNDGFDWGALINAGTSIVNNLVNQGFAAGSEGHAQGVTNTPPIQQVAAQPVQYSANPAAAGSGMLIVGAIALAALLMGKK